jgi:hypothetical protein
MKSFLTTFLISITIPFAVSANLAFDIERIDHEATLDETEYKAVFPFTNRGNKAVEILDVKSSCGCTTAIPSKRVFQPGESGEISATFDYGSREGKQIKSIRVETNQDPNPQIALTLQVNIPTALEVSPSVVMWNRATESEFKAKEVTITSELDESVEIVEVIASSDLFSHEIKVLDAGKKFTLAITPKDIPADQKGILRGTFLIKTSLSNPTKSTLKVYAIIR